MEIIFINWDGEYIFVCMTRMVELIEYVYVTIILNVC